MIHMLKYKLSNLVSDKRFSEILMGSAWALLARVIAAFLGMISSIIIARFYGADVLGIVAVVNSFLMLATIFTVLGTNTSILRLIPEHIVKYSITSAFKLYRKIQYLVIGGSLLTGVLLFFSSNLIAGKVFFKPHLTFYFALAAFFIVFKSLVLLNTQAVRGLRMIRVFAIMLVLPQGFNLILLILMGLLIFSMDVPVYALLCSNIMTGILGWFIMEYAFKKKIQPGGKIYPMPSRKILSLSLPMLVTATMAVVMSQAGLIMLGIFRSEAEVGYYAIATKLATLTMFAMQAIDSIAAPKFSDLFHSNKLDELFFLAQKSTKLIFWTSTPILLILVLLGKPLIYLLYGPNFKAAYWAMVMLILGQVINSITGSTGFFMNMTGEHKIYSKIVSISTIFNVILNIVFIPQFGIYGAALSGMSSIILWNVTTLTYIKRKHGKSTAYFPLFSKI
jgi:O-antigen/teichoic acid export membrane protein